MGQGASTPVAADPCLAVGEVARLLADGRPLPDVLSHLVAALSLRAAVVRSVQGDLLGVGGESLKAVPTMRAVSTDEAWLEFLIHTTGRHTATLTVQGARPSQVAALRSVAAVLGLVIRPTEAEHDLAAGLLDDAEARLDGVADALHDGPVQNLMAARYAADAAVRDGASPLLRDAIQEAVVELRRQLWALRPRGGAGLVAALSQLAEQLADAGAGPLRITAVDGADLAGRPAVAVYRLAQQLISDAHGPVELTVRAQGGNVVVEITGGAPLVGPATWMRMASALGGSLVASAGRVTFAMPRPQQATPLEMTGLRGASTRTDARTPS